MAQNNPLPPRPNNQYPQNRFSQGNANQPLVNEAIRSPNVRLISSTGEQLGIVPTREALEKARSEGLDLVVIGVQQPPVAKIMDYGKFKFEKEKEEKEKKKRSKSQSVFKELKLSSRIDEHDLQIKEKWICKWLEEGSKVRVVVQMKGREMQHPELARKLLQSVLAATIEHGKPDQTPPIKQEGRMFSLQLAPIQLKKV
jgi:translation initiation factor IF-3